MTEIRHQYGMVYILENVEAKRVKVGVTTSSVENRRIDVNQMWLGTKGTCQLCGGRINVNRQRQIPRHVKSGIVCSGSNLLPLEKDNFLAKSYLEELKIKHRQLSGTDLESSTRMINTLESRIKRFESIGERVGIWRINTVYYTDFAEEVERGSHQLLASYLDVNMQFGEVFSCSIEYARKAVETILEQKGISNKVKKEIITE